jgi:hypothetical protein
MTTKMIEAVEAISAAKPDVEVRVARRVEIGTVLHQGDVYLHAVPADWPRGELLGTRQVAVGTTVGSRHIAEGVDAKVYAGVRVPPSVDAWLASNAGNVIEDKDAFRAALLGPVVTGMECLTHPEHAHHAAPDQTWQVTYQVDALTGQRVSD